MKKVRTSDLELKDRLVSIQRVTKVTKGGRTFSFSAIVVVGNENGVVGYGLGKASCRAGVGRREERACQEQGFVEPPQPGEGYHRRSLRAARRSQRGTVARYLDESGV